MKLIKITTLALLLAISFNKANAQSKEETEKWIVEKINGLMSKKTLKYSITSTVTGVTADYIEEYIPAKFSLQDGKIIIVFKYTKSTNNKWVDGTDDGRTMKQRENIIITVSANIHSIDAASNLYRISGDPNLVFYGDVSYLKVQLKCSCASSEKSNGVKEKVDSLPVFIFENAEPNLITRLNKAFTQLKTFYPAPKESF